MSEPPTRSSPLASPATEQQQASFQTGANIRSQSSTSTLRQRPLGRATTFSEAGSAFAPAPSPALSPAPATSSKFRRNSALSDTVSEARLSIQTSTDELLFPRAKAFIAAGRGGGSLGENMNGMQHDSHWQSAPLALALLPAVGGLFFQNGSAVLTDATLLILAAIFLNWSVRLPWNWYLSAQEVLHSPPESVLSDNGTIVEEEEEDEEDNDEEEDNDRKAKRKQAKWKEPQENSTTSQTAIKELHMHEIAALISCFVFPLIGAWLLHAVRGALSRPSEGLVSNYNLTIFILAAEIRPFAHLLRMVQGRTLHLQRVVAAAAASSENDDEQTDHNKILDLATRLEDLEAHVADKAAVASNDNDKNQATIIPGTESIDPELVKQITAEVRQSFQPELDALNRAVRRYEKRTALMAFQIDSRMNAIEAQVDDAIALAVAAQQSASTTTNYRHYRDLVSLLGSVGDLLCALVIIPVKMMLRLISLPARLVSNIVALFLTTGGSKRRRKNAVNKGKYPKYQGQTQTQTQAQPQTQTQTNPRSLTSESRHVATPSTQGGLRPVKKGS